MKKKVGTQFTPELFHRLKRQAVDESRPISDIIEEAVGNYLAEQRPAPAAREAAFHVFCERPLRLSPKQFQHVLESDAWDS